MSKTIKYKFIQDGQVVEGRCAGVTVRYSATYTRVLILDEYGDEIRSLEINQSYKKGAVSSFVCDKFQLEATLS
jgi:hypothetical protein